MGHAPALRYSYWHRMQIAHMPKSPSECTGSMRVSQASKRGYLMARRIRATNRSSKRSVAEGGSNSARKRVRPWISRLWIPHMHVQPRTGDRNAPIDVAPDLARAAGVSAPFCTWKGLARIVFTWDRLRAMNVIPRNIYRSLSAAVPGG
jgi:hypothetical protein